MDTSKPVFVCVAGAWHTPEFLNEVAGLLAEKGYHSTLVSLPSVGANPPLPDFDQDVEAISKAVRETTNSGRDVVLAVHSYGGIPACQAMVAMMDDNEGKNGKGRVRRMAWITGFVPLEGQSLNKITGQDAPWYEREGTRFTAGTPEHIFFADLPPDVAAYWSAKLETHSYETFNSEVSGEPWQKIPSSYLVCEDDNAIPVEAQDGMIAAAKEKSGGKAFDHVERCGSGHSPFLSMPKTVVEFLERVAERK